MAMRVLRGVAKASTVAPRDKMAAEYKELIE